MPPPLTDLALAMVEPSDQDIAWAYECLRPVPFARSPVQHVARILALYRRELETEPVTEPVVGER